VKERAVKYVSTVWVQLLLVVATCSTVQAQSVDFSGDMRLGYMTFDRDERNGSTSDDAQLRMRFRAGVMWAGRTHYKVPTVLTTV
jgi:hypothetical protein